jgi:hypothetical protein
LTSDPNRSSLGLLPSGPDPVGEWFAHRQPPGPYIGGTGPDCKRGTRRLLLAYFQHSWGKDRGYLAIAGRVPASPNGRAPGMKIGTAQTNPVMTRKSPLHRAPKGSIR